MSLHRMPVGRLVLVAVGATVFTCLVVTVVANLRRDASRGLGVRSSGEVQGFSWGITPVGEVIDPELAVRVAWIGRWNGEVQKWPSGGDVYEMSLIPEPRSLSAQFSDLRQWDGLWLESSELIPGPHVFWANCSTSRIRSGGVGANWLLAGRLRRTWLGAVVEVDQGVVRVYEADSRIDAGLHSDPSIHGGE